MKVEGKVVSEGGYAKHSVKVTFESISEAQAYYALFNRTEICNWLREHGVDPSAVREEISENAPEEFSSFKTFKSFQSLIRGLR